MRDEPQTASGPRQSIHDGWTPQPQEQVEPGDPWFNPEDDSQDEALGFAARAAAPSPEPDYWQRRALEAGNQVRIRDASPAPVPEGRMSDEPQTESGRALLRDYLSPGGTTMFLSDILAIEKEAASKAVAEVLDRLNSGLHTFSLVFVDGDGDLWRCSCGEQGFDFRRGIQGYVQHIAAPIASERER